MNCAGIARMVGQTVNYALLSQSGQIRPEFSVKGRPLPMRLRPKFHIYGVSVSQTLHEGIKLCQVENPIKTPRRRLLRLNHEDVAFSGCAIMYDKVRKHQAGLV